MQLVNDGDGDAQTWQTPGGATHGIHGPGRSGRQLSQLSQLSDDSPLERFAPDLTSLAEEGR